MEQGIHIYVSIPIAIRSEREISRSCCNEESFRPSNKIVTLFINAQLFSLIIFLLFSSSK